jgi:hypothetical protein
MKEHNPSPCTDALCGTKFDGELRDSGCPDMIIGASLTIILNIYLQNVVNSFDILFNPSNFATIF